MPDSFRIDITDNSDAVGAEFDMRVLRALEECGLVAEGYSKKLVKVDTGNLRNSVTHQVVPDERAVYIGTNLEYGVYQELGTGQYAEGGGAVPRRGSGRTPTVTGIRLSATSPRRLSNPLSPTIFPITGKLSKAN